MISLQLTTSCVQRMNNSCMDMTMYLPHAFYRVKAPQFILGKGSISLPHASMCIRKSQGPSPFRHAIKAAGTCRNKASCNCSTYLRAGELSWATSIDLEGMMWRGISPRVLLSDLTCRQGESLIERWIACFCIRQLVIECWLWEFPSISHPPVGAFEEFGSQLVKH